MLTARQIVRELRTSPEVLERFGIRIKPKRGRFGIAEERYPVDQLRQAIANPSAPGKLEPREVPAWLVRHGDEEAHLTFNYHEALGHADCLNTMLFPGMAPATIEEHRVRIAAVE